MKAFREREKKTGVAPAPLLTQPRLQYQDLEYLEAFRYLSGGRTYGFASPNPIPVSEMLAYSEMRGIASVVVRSKYLRLLRILDSTFLQHASEQQPKTPPK